MPKIEPFEKYVDRYEKWFVTNSFACESELQAVRALLPEGQLGVEIGVGTGRFAARLGIKFGVEPSKAMREVAKKRGTIVVDGVAEALPFEDDRFDFALMVTTICFLDDLEMSLKEAGRVIKPRGYLVIGFLDRNTAFGRTYQKHKDKSIFYRLATLYSTDEVISHLEKAGFRNFHFTQTIFRDLTEIREVEPVKDGYGQGFFVVVRGMNPWL